MTQCRLRQMVVVQPYKPMQPIEALDHAVGLRCLGLGQPVFNAQRLAQPIEPVLPCGLAAAVAKQPVCELFAVVREESADRDRGSLAHRCQEGFGCSCRFVLFDGNEHPACRPVDSHSV